MKEVKRKQDKFNEMLVRAAQERTQVDEAEGLSGLVEHIKKSGFTGAEDST